MEVKNGIIIDGVLHEVTYNEVDISCDKCSLEELCYDRDIPSPCSTVFDCGIFINRGKVKIEKEETEWKIKF